MPACCCAGNITVPAAVNTNYTFYMDSDDGSQLTIDGKLLIDKGGAPLCWRLTEYSTRILTGQGHKYYSCRRTHDLSE